MAFSELTRPESAGLAGKQSKLDSLEGLRGIAACVVMLCHIRLALFINLPAAIAHQYGPVLGTMLLGFLSGEFAVWLFWVMSAFVLSIRFHAASEDAVAVKVMTDAAIRRYPRLLLPVLGSVLFAWALHACGMMTNAKLARQLGPDYEAWLGGFYAFEPSLPYALKTAIWQSFFFYNASASYNHILWTMEIELYGSFFLFGLLALIGKHPARLLFYTATLVVVYKLGMHWINAFVLGAMVCDAHVHSDALRRWLPSRVDAAMLHLWHSRTVACLIVLLVLYLIGLQNVRGVSYLALATFVTAYVATSTPAKFCFSRRMPVFLGTISFGLYLMHIPLICAFAYPLYNASLTGLFPRAAVVVTSLCLVVMSLVGGFVLWYVADRPAIRFSRAIARVLNGGQ